MTADAVDLNSMWSMDAEYLARIAAALGKPADAIVEYVSKNPVNLIVMSTHGRSGLGRWVFGSVAERVLLGVTSPILLIRPR
jgi:nucleotide-binding universal stress UspA family protein